MAEPNEKDVTQLNEGDVTRPNDNDIDELAASTKMLSFSTTSTRFVSSRLPQNVANAVKSSRTTPTCSAKEPRRMTVFFSPEFAKHRPPPGRKHPECPERLDACVKALKHHADLSGLLDWATPVPVEGNRRDSVLSAVRAIHRFPDYLEELERDCKRGAKALGPDTYLSQQSYEIALLAASSWMQAVDTAMGDAHAAFALVRPPGHHATPAAGMGFCLLSNAAIAAKYARMHHEVKNVAILDFDVHHGNGTEASVKNEEGIRFVSSHQWPLYPGSGAEGTIGKYDNVLNINLDPGTGIKGYRKRLEDEILPFLLKSDDGLPELIIVSAGYDAMSADPLAQLEFQPEDYRLFTELILEASGTNTRIVFGLEGGYNLGETGLGAAVAESIAGYCCPR